MTDFLSKRLGVMTAKILFNFMITFYVIGLCLVSTSYCDSYSDSEARERIIERTMSMLKAKEDLSRQPEVYVSEQNFESDHRLRPRFEANWRYSNDRSIMMGEFWLPIVQCKEDAVFFCDLRIMGDDSDNKEFNVGAGYREVLRDTIIGNGVAGAMVWFDRRFTDRDFQFNQITLGGEWLGEQFDLRVNGYVPLDKKKTYTQTNLNGTGKGFVGNQILVNTNQVVVEEVLPGLDFEAGARLKFMNTITDSTRLFMGGYHFEGDRVEDITGVRTRIVSDITSDVQLGVRFQHDDVRGSQTYFESTIRFPFGHKKKYKHEGYWSRLDESPERDIDVVSNEAVTVAGTNITLLNATTNTTQNVIHVDNTAAVGGDGTVETPYNTLAAAEGVAVDNDIIYVHVGDATTTGQNTGITLDDAGQMLIGSGVDLFFTSNRFQTSNGMAVPGKIIEATSAPKITNGAGNGVDITADDVFVSGVTVDGSNVHGIYALNSNNLVIDQVSALNSGSSIPLFHTGIRIEADAKALDSATVTNSTVENSGNRGINFLANNGGSIDQVTVTGNISRNHPVHGIIVEAIAAGSVINNANISNNIASTNNNKGLIIYSDNGGSINTVDFMNNSLESNRTGISVNSTNASVGTVNFEGNVANNSILYGLLAQALSGGDIENLSFSDNTVTNSSNSGVYVHAIGAGSKITTTNFTNNTVDSSALYGLYAYTLSGGDIGEVNFTSNAVTNNTSYGIRAEASGVGSTIATANFTSNTSSNNGASGYLAYSQSTGNLNTVNFDKNVADGNTDYGLWAYAQSDGDIGTVNITNNMTTNSTSSGIRAVASGAGSTITAANVSNNTASSNGSGLYVRAISDGDIGQLSIEENIISNNTTNGIVINDDSVAGGIAADLGGGVFGSTGGNSIFGNTDEELFVDIDGGNLKAENNWWGSVSGLTGAETVLQDASTVDTTPFLIVNPE